MVLNDKTKQNKKKKKKKKKTYNVISTDREVLIKSSMGANIVSFFGILREKLQFMYNFNRFVAFMLFFRTTKTLKAVHR